MSLNCKRMEKQEAQRRQQHEECPLETVERFRQGQREAFVEIIDKYHSDVHCLAIRLLGWDGHAEDVAQDVFMAAFVNRKRFRGDSSVRTWLFTITANKCRTWKYKQKIKQKFLNWHKQERVETGYTDQGSQVEETHEQVRKAVGKLPVKYRQVVVLKYLNEMEAGEISKILGLSTAAVNTRLSRAREMLKESLGGIEKCK